MASSVRKKTKAERQAELRDIHHNGRAPGDNSVHIPGDDDEPNIDDLLGDMPVEPVKRREKQSKPEGEPKEKKKALRPVKVDNRPIIMFRTKGSDKLIIGPGVKYMVVRTPDGKLHYKEASQVTFLPEDWKPGDSIPGFENKETDDLL